VGLELGLWTWGKLISCGVWAQQEVIFLVLKRLLSKRLSTLVVQHVHLTDLVCRCTRRQLKLVLHVVHEIVLILADLLVPVKDAQIVSRKLTHWFGLNNELIVLTVKVTGGTTASSATLSVSLSLPLVQFPGLLLIYKIGSIVIVLCLLLEQGCVAVHNHLAVTSLGHLVGRGLLECCADCNLVMPHPPLLILIPLERFLVGLWSKELFDILQFRRLTAAVGFASRYNFEQLLTSFALDNSCSLRGRCSCRSPLFGTLWLGLWHVFEVATYSGNLTRDSIAWFALLGEQTWGVSLFALTCVFRAVVSARTALTLRIYIDLHDLEVLKHLVQLPRQVNETFNLPFHVFDFLSQCFKLLELGGIGIRSQQRFPGRLWRRR